jgi:hypothetical protein
VRWSSDGGGESDVPFGTDCDLVQLLLADFAKVLVGAGLLLHDADAAAVLPDLADVALNEETTQIVAWDIDVGQGGAGLASVRWQARVLLIATDAAGDLVFLSKVVVEVIFELCNVVLVVVLLACAAAGQWGLDERVEGRLLGLF